MTGGIFLLIKKNSSNKATTQSPVSPKDNPPPEPDPTESNKIKMKVFWVGSLGGFDEYQDYWVFSTETNQPDFQRFLIAKNNPLFNNKKLDQAGLTFTLSYSEKEIGKKVEKTNKAGKSILTILESRFNLVPNSPWEEEADFPTRWAKGRDIKAELQFDDVNNVGNYIFKVLTNLTENRIENFKASQFFVISPDNYRIKKLRQENKLVSGKKFLLTCQPVMGDYRYSELARTLYIGKLSKIELSKM